MNSRLHKFLIFTCLMPFAVLQTACHNGTTGEVMGVAKQNKEKKDSPFIAGNQKILQLETEEIELFIQRYGWKMQHSGTGLYYQILDAGTGETFKEGDDVQLSYQTFSLDGKLIYDSKEDGNKLFRVARSEEIAGLHEAAQMLRPGAKARLIVPSHLAYGVAGDGNKINGRMAIAMEISIDKQQLAFDN